MTRQLAGSLQPLKERLEQYRQANEEFIIMHSGLSRYRALRAFIVEEPKRPSAPSQIFVYDAIVLRRVVQTAQRRKEESISKLKSDLNALSAEEKEGLKEDMVRHSDFLNNPFFYADLPDLLVDLNFKHYLQTIFTSVFNTKGERITSFSEVEPEEDEVVIAGEISGAEARGVVRKIASDKRLGNVFYTEYKHILEQPGAVPLHLENFAETKEFFEGLDPVIQQKTNVSPIKSHEQSIQAGPHIKLAKSLNKNPLRCKSPDRVIAVLPTLPQRYVIDKRNFKIPSLRYVPCASRYPR